MTHGKSSLTAALLALTLAGASTAQASDLAIENFMQADVNGDGVLVYAEFASFIDLNAADNIGNSKRVSARGLHAMAFERVDTNEDGVVSSAELQALQ